MWIDRPNEVNSNSVTAILTPDGEAPEFMAVIVLTNDPMDSWRKEMNEEQERWRSERKTNASARFVMKPPPPPVDYFANANWIPFATNHHIDLGPGDGKRKLLFSFRYKGQTRSGGWDGSDVLVQTSPLIVGFLEPRGIISRPIVQLKGYSTRPLESIHFDVVRPNGAGAKRGEQGFVNDQYFDAALFEFTTNYFTCHDIELSPGTNRIELHFKDRAGNTLNTNVTLVLDLEHHRTPPVLLPRWPANGEAISGSSFTARGWLDDDNANLVGEIVGEGQTNTVEGLVERGGVFWVEHLPLRSGANVLMLTATDAAGNLSRTNLLVYRSEVQLEIDPIPEQDLTNFAVKLTGRVSPANYEVWVNGIQAVVEADGRWMIARVPVSGMGGAAVFDATAIPNSINRTNRAAGETPLAPERLVSIQAALGQEAMTLNANREACGKFVLHLSGTEGRNFVLLDSTNLIDWRPVLTNFGSAPAFDFADTNMGKYDCRFFRVVPLQ